MLLEELLEDQQMITGYTGNYIKVYVPYEDPEAAQGMLNQFVSVELLEVAGMACGVGWWKNRYQ